MSVPVTTSDDVLAVLPHFLKTGDPAPIRDAIVAALTEIFRTYQVKSTYAAAQSDPETATGIYLKGLAEDHQVFASSGETDASLRARIFAAPALVSPTAILAAVNSITGPFTTVLAQLFESEIDCGFVHDGNPANAYDSFIGTNPHYSDRLYLDDVAENGVDRPQSQPDGFWSFADQNGRFFVIRLPVLDAADTDFSWVTDSDPDEMFISDNTDASGAELDGSDISFVYIGGTTADDLYGSIINVIDRIKAQGFRYEIWVDPGLI